MYNNAHRSGRSDAMGFAAFAGHKYLNLETFKKSGEGVKTPVWFAADPSASLDSSDAKLYVYTIGVSGKVKRIRNNPRVKIAPCDMRRQSAWRMGGSGVWRSSPGRGCPRNAVAQQEVFPVETDAGFFRDVPPARKDCLRDPAGVN